jgi:hypothetical protein
VLLAITLGRNVTVVRGQGTLLITNLVKMRKPSSRPIRGLVDSVSICAYTRMDTLQARERIHKVNDNNQMVSKEEVDKLRIAWQEADALSRVYQGLARDAMTAYMTAIDEKTRSEYDPELQRLLKIEDIILKRHGYERTTESKETD